jgi:hypothetical protein
MDQVSFASVSAGAPVASRSCAAAAADGANPSIWPPPSLHARARVDMAVVLPAPAGAIASCSRAPELHMTSTRAACPASKALPLAAASKRASSMAPASTARPSVRPAVVTNRCSAAKIRAEVNSSDPATVYTLEPSTRRNTAGSLIPSSVRVSATDRVRSTSVTSSSTSGSTLSVSISAARMWRCASARTCQLCQVERCSSTAANTFTAAAASHSASTAGPDAEIGLRVLLIMVWTASGPPSVSAAWACQAVRCSAKLRGSCLASRVSKVACCANCNASTGLGGRP